MEARSITVAGVTRDVSSPGRSLIVRSKPWVARYGTSLSGWCFLVVGGLLVYRTIVGLNVPGKPHAPAWGLQDFRDAIFYPVVALLDGNNPYDAVAYAGTYPVGNTFPLYPPLTLLVHLPLGLMSYTTAEVAYLLVSALLTLPIAALCLRLAGVQPSWGGVFVVATLILLSRPGYWNLFLGQYAATLALGFYAALYFARTRPGVAALGVTLAMLKPTYGVPLIVLMLAQGHARPVFVGIVSSAVLSAPVAAVIIRNAGGFGSFVRSLQSGQAAFDMDPEVNPALSTYRVDAVALLSRWIGDPLPLAAEALVLIAVLGVAALAVRHLRSGATVNEAPWNPLAIGVICVAVLLCTYHQPYDLVLLVAPATALATGALTGGLAVPRWQRWTLGLGFAGLAANYLVSGTALGRLSIRGAWWVAVTSLNGLALLVILSIYLGLAFRRQRGALAAQDVAA